MKTIKSTFILSLLLSSVCLTNCRKEIIEEEEVIKVKEVFLESICGESPNSYFKYKFHSKIENTNATVLATPPNVLGEKYYYIKFTNNDKVSHLYPCNFPKEYKVEGLNIIISANLYSLICKSQQCLDGAFGNCEILSIEKK